MAVFGENRAWLEVCCGTTIRLRLMSAIQGGALGGMLFRSLLQEPSLSRYVPNSTTWSFITRVRNEEGEKIVDANRDPHHSRAPYKAACNHERGCAIHMTELCVRPLRYSGRLWAGRAASNAPGCPVISAAMHWSSASLDSDAIGHRSSRSTGRNRGWDGRLEGAWFAPLPIK